MNKAIFLDRDGVINELVYNPKRKEFEPPHEEEDLKLIEGSLNAIKTLFEYGYKMFLISNQPDYAKGKTTLAKLEEVHNKLHNIFSENEIVFSKYFYCYHHPDGIDPEYGIDCECRKPKNFFVKSAVNEFEINTNQSWFIGDRDTDILCGKNSGLKTILIENNYDKKKIETPDFRVASLKEAVPIILKFKN